FADRAKCRRLLRSRFIRAAAAARAEDDSDSLVFVQRPRKIRRRGACALLAIAHKSSANAKLNVTPDFFIPFSPERSNARCRNKKVYLVVLARQNYLFVVICPR